MLEMSSSTARMFMTLNEKLICRILQRDPRRRESPSAVRRMTTIRKRSAITGSIGRTCGSTMKPQGYLDIARQSSF